jgi:UDP-galactopyranose mutase
MTVHIIGAGIVGCTLAELIPKDCVLYERDEVGGACVDNKNYQKYVHVMHTDYEDVWQFVNSHTDVKPHKTLLKSYVRGELLPWLPKELSKQVIEDQVRGYSKKQWLTDPPQEALDRIKTDPDGLIFREKYEGVPNYTKLFDNLTKDKTIIKRSIKHGDLPEGSEIILTGAIDEYFDYCYGELPYRGMQSVHFQSEVRLEADFYTFSDEKIPFQRIIDYDRLGYEGGWIGIEIACGFNKHYPVRTPESEAMYEKYVELANKHNIGLAGRLATYRYIDSDDAVKQAIDYVKENYEI